MNNPLPSSIRFLYFVLLWCVFSFKVFLGGVGEAGLRVDDLLLAIALAVLVSRGDIARVPRSAAIRAYSAFVLVSAISAVWNGLLGRVAFVYSLLFVARLVEYMTFYYLGYVLVESGARVWRWLKVYFYVVWAVVLLQMFHVLSSASSFSASRASGNTNGPYELAAVAAFFFCYFGFRKGDKLNAGGSFGLLILTASRVTFAGTVIAFIRRYLSLSRSKIRAVSVVLLAVLVIAAGARVMPSGDTDEAPSASIGSRLSRSTSLMSVDYSGLFANVPTYQTSGEYMAGMFADSGSLAKDVDADRSGMLRILRWASLVKSAAGHPDSMAIGLGPSFGSAAVDGYFVRVFAETGLLGLVTFFVFLWTLIRRQNDESGAFREFIIILVVTACFIDIFASYKAMLFLWLWNGMNEYEWRHKCECA